MNSKNPSALSTKSGVDAIENISANSVKTVLKSRATQPSSQVLIQGILNKDITALSRAITIVESNNPKHSDKASSIIEGCLPNANKSIRIGITGVPGVGKSTFIEAFGTYLTSLGFRVAVLAVDPSSTISHGSILGDKTRMEELVKDKNAFIRPSAAGTTLGGVARKTREIIILCEAAGFDLIIIETVGVGQSETAVQSMVDFFLLLKIAGAGDELQGIKRGIMEMADMIVINKADGDNIRKSRLARTDFIRALHLFPPKKSGFDPTVEMCSSIEQTGISNIWNQIEKYFELVKSNGYFAERRRGQNEYWMLETISEHIHNRFFENESIKSKLVDLKVKVGNGSISPFAAAQEIICFSEKI